MVKLSLTNELKNRSLVLHLNKKFVKYVFILVLLLLSFTSLFANNSDSLNRLKSISFTGYVKGLIIFNLDNHFKNTATDELIHQRLNFRWQPNKNIKAVAEFRNRIFAGNRVKTTKNFSGILKSPSEQWNLESIWFETNEVVIHTNTERFYLESVRQSWNFRAGRQRINWGMATTWNPNDLFNAWNFLDFDYEERAGADALNLKFSGAGLSEFSAVYAFSANQRDVAALRYFFNHNRFDFQIITGFYRGQFNSGAGWAGHIGESGFKGEVQYYYRTKNEGSHFNLTSEIDHLLGKGWYISSGLLFNSLGQSRPVQKVGEINLNLSVDNLMPGRWSIFLSARKEINPLSAGNLNFVFSPGLNLMILIGTLSYNLLRDIDADLIWQSFFAETGSKFQNVNHLGFVRLRWSF